MRAATSDSAGEIRVRTGRTLLGRTRPPLARCDGDHIPPSFLMRANSCSHLRRGHARLNSFCGPGGIANRGKDDVSPTRDACLEIPSAGSDCAEQNLLRRPEESGGRLPANQPGMKSGALARPPHPATNFGGQPRGLAQSKLARAGASAGSLVGAEELRFVACCSCLSKALSAFLQRTLLVDAASTRRRHSTAQHGYHLSLQYVKTFQTSSASRRASLPWR